MWHSVGCLRWRGVFHAVRCSSYIHVHVQYVLSAASGEQIFSCHSSPSWLDFVWCGHNMSYRTRAGTCLAPCVAGVLTGYGDEAREHGTRARTRERRHEGSKGVSGRLRAGARLGRAHGRASRSGSCTFVGLCSTASFRSERSNLSLRCTLPTKALSGATAAVRSVTLSDRTVD